MGTETEIKVENLCKRYRTMLSRNKYTEVLHNINFEAREGERIGIIGRNGAGKSTLLHVLSGHAKADAGDVKIKGKISSILDVGTNLQFELSGKDNIRDIGTLYGYSGEKLEEKLLEVEEFVELGEYWERPVKTYSSGMKARIAFAQIAFIDPEILIIDEVLGVGDVKFLEKSQKKVKELCDRGKILLIVSHSLEMIAQMANRCIWIEKGEIREDGEPREVISLYEEFVNELERNEAWKQRRTTKNRNKDNKTYIADVILSKNDSEETIFETGDDIDVELQFVLDNLKNNYDFMLQVEDYRGNILFENLFSEDNGCTLSCYDSKQLNLSTKLLDMSFTESVCTLRVYLYENGEQIDVMEKKFRIADHKREYYSLPIEYVESRWEADYKGEKIKNEHKWTNSGCI